MKILLINGSPRKGGNSEVLCEQFAKGATEAGHEAEKIDLYKQKISPCVACYGCRKTQTCVIKDDMQTVLEKMIAADVIVLSSPVYFYSLSGQLKVMIDRCLPRYQEMKGKKFYYIITAADPQHSAADETIAAFRGFLRCLPKAEEAGIIYGCGTWDKGDVYRHPAYEKAYEMGKQV